MRGDGNSQGEAGFPLQMLPAPHPGIDQILPGRTCQRDLIAELADALASRGKPLLVYYNHSCNQGEDRAWEQAVGYHDRDKQRFAQNLTDIVGWMGEKYKNKIRAWLPRFQSRFIRIRRSLLTFESATPIRLP